MERQQLVELACCAVVVTGPDSVHDLIRPTGDSGPKADGIGALLKHARQVSFQGVEQGLRMGARLGQRQMDARLGSPSLSV